MEVRVSKGVRQVVVPDVLGQSESSARAELEDAGFEVAVTQAPSDDTDEGLVSSQSPLGGHRGRAGLDRHDHDLDRAASSSPSPTWSARPSRAPGRRSGMRGLRPSTVCDVVTDPAQDGIVIDQDPGGGSQASPGSTVTIVVGRLSC